MKIFNPLEKIVRDSMCLITFLSALSCGGGSGKNKLGVLNTGIVYASDRAGASKIYLNDTEGNDEQVTFGAGIDFDPALSPDGTLIAFAREEPRGVAELYKIRTNGSGLEQITFNGGYTVHPAWASDQKRLAYEDIVGGYSDILARDLENPAGADNNLTNTPFDDEKQPSWGAGEIAYWMWDPVAPRTANIHSMKDDGTDKKPLTGSGYMDSEPTFSYDGTRILFSRASSSTPFTTTVWIMNNNGQYQEELTPASAPDTYNWHPSLSPDKEWFTYASYDKDGDLEVFIRNLATKEVIKLTDNLDDDRAPYFGLVSK